MRHAIIAAALAAALALAPAAGGARGLNVSTDACKYDYGTPYDVDVARSGLTFHRTDGTPGRIVVHDGSLEVDGRAVAVSAADAEALRRYESGVRQLMPEVAAVAREGIQLGFSAMTTVTMTFAEADRREELLARIRRKQADALREIDQGVGAGHWSSVRMTELTAGSVADSVGELVGSVTSNAVTAALSGDTAKVAALQARAASLDKALDSEMDKRSKALEARAKGICPRLDALAGLQRGWGIRLADGSPLALMTVRPRQESRDTSGGDGASRVARD
ncbi:DUF2884 family protein [Luteibacter sahnii]|jgi:hypothetical protein|uniref:DUF2884 family protein n=1 Tax=Luteibacter sahnii TaxID=3021977 RepID=UPI002A6ACA91|nr:DUF2884 family protein [Luteibacter sp. PPL193]MDY1548666.1 DUF2884 family protein [Luteibacter sp. PPL193]